MSETTTSPHRAKQRVPIPIRLKLLGSVVVPLVAVAVMCYLQVDQARDRVDEVEVETALASVTLQPGGLVDALITEQGDATVTLLGLRETSPIPTENFDASMEDTDEAIANFRQALDAGGPVAQELFATTISGIETDLDALRAEFHRLQSETGDKSPLVNLVPVLEGLYPGYSEIIEDVIAANDELGRVISDPGMRAAAETLSAVHLINYNTSRLTSAVGTSILREGNEGRDPVVRYLAEFERSLERVQPDPDLPWNEAAVAVVENPNFGLLVSRAHDFLEVGEIDLEAYISLNPGGETRETSPLGSSQKLAQDTSQGLAGMINTQLDDARAEQRRYTILAIGTLILATGAALLIARSILKPMRKLTDQAEEMALVTLPAAVAGVLETAPGQDVVVPRLEPITVSSRDELQTVATAINHVQSSALDLAVEQATLRRNIADSFVSLGRRTQNLISLQLELITNLERDEADPAQLEQLYRLDHLATRARRNAESLVVLGGTASEQSGGAPVAMTDVVRAMLSEVEAYQRVDITAIDDALVPGRSAADAIHLMAELVENGLSFSPPNTTVHVTGRRDPQGYTIQITDQGVGMTEDRLAQANRRLADNESFTVAPSRYLGHYVTGKLAARVGATVSLASSHDGGVVATVFIPSSALVSTVQAQTDHSAAAPTPGADQNAPAPSPASTDGMGDADAVAAAAYAASQADQNHNVKVDGRPPAFAGAADVPSGHQIESVAAAQNSAPAVADREIELTGSGLRKRVPGVHAQAVRDRSPLLRSAAARSAGQAPLGAETSPQAAENLASLLGEYTSGLERGRGDDTDNLANTEQTE